MAQRSHASEHPNLKIVPRNDEVCTVPVDDNVIRGNFPSLPIRRETTLQSKRHEIMRRLGKIAAAVKFQEVDRAGNVARTELHDGDVLWSEPMHVDEDEQGNVAILFKQVLKGYSGDGYGMPQMGDQGLETISVLSVSWDAARRATLAEYVLARNFRYKFMDYEAELRKEGFADKMTALRSELWND